MNKRRRLAILLVLATLTIAGLCRLLDNSWLHSNHYSGDGVLIDNGFLSYPRYQIEFSPCSLKESNKWRFVFTGVPTGEMIIGLEILCPSEVLSADQLSQLVANTHVNMSISVFDKSGQNVYSHSGKVTEWQCFESVRRCYYWKSGCEVKFKSNTSYDMVVEFRDINPSAANVVLKPFFSGGGNEMP